MDADRLTQASMAGGCIEKEVAAVTAMPFTASPAPVLMMHTPAAWRRTAVLNEAASSTITGNSQ